ncbi:zinc-binding metallopeptidase family protein [Salipiger abyssi]|uniref:zinc-binding metallopeptidase family protein n=1 Tax=Salipiger abyssi TaxID=1250539 RepID=UPI004059D61A
MQIFQCPNCGAPLYFHNTGCTCGQQVSFDPERQLMQPAAEVCANREIIGCNWQAEAGGLCRSCAMTETLPDLREAENRPLWEISERAKRWMLANLARWGWFTEADPGGRPVFRLLSENTAVGPKEIVMGHANGIITINVTEASDAVLALRQEQFGELYRTMLGHMRHEIAHYLFLRLSAEPGFLEAFRSLFGDERQDYGAALEAHYAEPQPAGYDHVTSYATAHPHEDWAESIAHLLHLVDLLDSAAAAGLAVPGGPPPGYDAYAESDTEAEITLAVDLSIAMNHVNRALDLPDLYPFVLAQGVRDKLGFAHGWLRRR